MKLLKKFWKYIKYDMSWLDRFYISMFLIMMTTTVFFAIPENNCKYFKLWGGELSSAGLIPNRSNRGCYQVGLKYEQKQDYAKAKYYFDEAARKAQIVCDSGKNKDACPLAEKSRTRASRMIELEKK